MYYRLLSTWRIQAPLEQVFAAIEHSLDWPTWWPEVVAVAELAAGDARGIGNIRRYRWQGRLPYHLVFDVCASHIEDRVAIAGTVQGDLEGTGCWDFAQQGPDTVVRYTWQVRTTRGWMNLIAPFARATFIRNHERVMGHGAAGLARLLGAPRMSQETLDLPGPPPVPIGDGQLLAAGIGAGVAATLAQFACWWVAGMPLAETLVRDARMTAALVLGSGILGQTMPPAGMVLLVATPIHFILSLAYAWIPARFFTRLGSGPAVLAGAAYGLALYGINMYGLTSCFPWFAVARDWPTVVAHVVFGMTVVGGCQSRGNSHGAL